MGETIITVGRVEKDEGGNLWVTPAGGGDRVKIAAKRSHLFPLFQQGKSVMLDWQTYLNRQYVADAKEVAGEAVRVIRTPDDLPKEGKIIPGTGKGEPPKVIPKDELTRSQEIEKMMWWKLLGSALETGLIDKEKPQGAQLKTAYILEMLRVLNIKLQPKP